MKAMRWEQEKLRRRSRSPEHAAATRPGNRSRRVSQLTECVSWDYERRTLVFQAGTAENVSLS